MKPVCVSACGSTLFPSTSTKARQPAAHRQPLQTSASPIPPPLRLQDPLCCGSTTPGAPQLRAHTCRSGTTQGGRAGRGEEEPRGRGRAAGRCLPGGHASGLAAAGARPPEGGEGKLASTAPQPRRPPPARRAARRPLRTLPPAHEAPLALALAGLAAGREGGGEAAPRRPRG